MDFLDAIQDPSGKKALEERTKQKEVAKQRLLAIPQEIAVANLELNHFKDEVKATEEAINQSRTPEQLRNLRGVLMEERRAIASREQRLKALEQEKAWLLSFLLKTTEEIANEAKNPADSGRLVTDEKLRKKRQEIVLLGKAGVQWLYGNDFKKLSKDKQVKGVQTIIDRARAVDPGEYQRVAELQPLLAFLTDSANSFMQAYAYGESARARLETPKKNWFDKVMDRLGIKKKISQSEADAMAKEKAEERMREVRKAMEQQAKQKTIPPARESLAVTPAAAEEAVGEQSRPTNDGAIQSSSNVSGISAGAGEATDIPERQSGGEDASPVAATGEASPGQPDEEAFLVNPREVGPDTLLKVNGSTLAFEPGGNISDKGIALSEPIPEDGMLEDMPNVEESKQASGGIESKKSAEARFEARPGLSAIKHGLEETVANLNAFGGLAIENFDAGALARVEKMFVEMTGTIIASIDQLVADIDSVSDSSELAVFRDSLTPLKNALADVLANIRILSGMRESGTLSDKNAEVANFLRGSAGSITAATKGLIQEIDKLAISSQGYLLDPELHLKGVIGTLHQAIAEQHSLESTSEVTPGSVDLSVLHHMELDPLFKDAVNVVLKRGRASAVVLQRELGIGYARGVRILDQMTEAGIAGPDVPTGAREIKVAKEQWEQFFNGL